MDISDSYKYCKESDITSSMLLGGEPLQIIPDIKNGLVLELFAIKKIKKESVSWSDFIKWIKTISGNEDPISIAAIQKSVTKLQSKKTQLQKSKSKNGCLVINSFLESPYKIPGNEPRRSRSSTVNYKVPWQSFFMKEVIATVNKSLAAENAALKEKCTAKENEIEKFKRKLRKRYNACKKIKRKYSTVNHFKDDFSKPDRMKRLREQIRYYKTKCDSLTIQLKELECEECQTLQTSIEQLKSEKRELLHLNSEYRDTIKELKSRKIQFYKDNKYTDTLRICIMELLSYNVGILNVSPIIQSVLHLAGLDYDKLPERTTINEILIESRSLAHMQLAETLTHASNSTLHSDGTTKFGHKYTSYQMSTTEGALTLGLQVSQNIPLCAYVTVITL